MSDIFVDNIKHQSSQGSGTITVGASGETVAPASGVMTKLGVFENQLLHVRDEKAQDTHGGSSSAGANTRDLNTVKTNEITGASLSSNQVTLPAGTYYAEGSAPVYKANYTHCYLYNVTDSATELVGSTQYAINTYNGYQTGTFCGRFTISAQKTFEVRSYTLAGLATFGLGLKALDINISVFADLRIWRIS